MHVSPLTLALALGLAASAAVADLKVRQRVTQGGLPRTAPSGEVTQYFSQEVMLADDPNVRAVIDATAGTFTLMDKRKRTYYTAPLAGLRAQAEQALKVTADLPAASRKRYGVDAPVTVKPTGRTATMAGQPVREFTLAGGPARARVWVAEGIELPPVARDWQRLSAPLRGQVRPGANLAAEVNRMKGMPLRSTLTVKLGHGQSFKSMSEVIELRDEAAPAELRAVPDGFTKIDPPVFQP